MSTEMELNLDPLPRGSEKITELSLGTTSVKVRTDATPALLKQTRDLVDSKFVDFAGDDKGGMSESQAAVLVAYSLAEELLKEQERVRSLKRKVLDKTEGLLNRVEAHLETK